MAATRHPYLLDPASRRDPRERMIGADREALREPALAAALGALSVLRLLPEAFAQAQRRELERVRRSDPDGKQSPRIEALQAAIVRADALRETGHAGDTRLERLLKTADDERALFHGFVSDAELRPIARARVQLIDASGKSSTQLRAETDADGYFRIVLADSDPLSGSSGSGSLFGKRAARQKTDPKNAKVDVQENPDATAEEASAQVEIFVGSTLVHHDPMPVPLAEGSVYREYAVGDGAAVSQPRSGNTPKPAPAPVTPVAKTGRNAKAGATKDTTAATEQRKTPRRKPK